MIKSISPPLTLYFSVPMDRVQRKPYNSLPASLMPIYFPEPDQSDWYFSRPYYFVTLGNNNHGQSASAEWPPHRKPTATTSEHTFVPFIAKCIITQRNGGHVIILSVKTELRLTSESNNCDQTTNNPRTVAIKNSFLGFGLSSRKKNPFSIYNHHHHHHDNHLSSNYNDALHKEISTALLAHNGDATISDHGSQETILSELGHNY